MYNPTAMTMGNTSDNTFEESSDSGYWKRYVGLSIHPVKQIAFGVVFHFNTAGVWAVKDLNDIRMWMLEQYGRDVHFRLMLHSCVLDPHLRLALLDVLSTT